MKKGIATILIVLLVGMMAVFMMTAWETRLLLQIHRNQALSDILKAEYAAESEIYDVISRFVGNYPLPTYIEKFLADGTKMTLDRSVNGNKTTLNITANRPFASSKFKVEQIVNEANGNNWDKVQVLLLQDCTGSLENRADPNVPGFTRMQALKKAMLTFLNDANNLDSNIKNKIDIGWISFRSNSVWVKDEEGKNIEPRNNYNKIISKVESGLGSVEANSPVCTENSDINEGGLNYQTNLGKPIEFALNYYLPKAKPKIKQIMIMITDGVPNVATVNHSCKIDQMCGYDNPADKLICKYRSVNFIECMAAPTSIQWSPRIDEVTNSSEKIRGQRDPNIDLYAVTILKDIQDPLDPEYYANKETRKIFSNTQYVKKYYNSEDANKVSGFLSEILQDIITSNITISIERVIPTL